MKVKINNTTYTENINLIDVYNRSILRKRLYEVYSKIDIDFVRNLILELQKFLKGQLSIEKIQKDSLKNGIGFMLYPNQDNEAMICSFDPYLNLIIIPIYKNTIKALKTDTLDINSFVNLIEASIVHEDTHKQQFKKYFFYSKNYKLPDTTNNLKLTNKNIAYYNQIIEAQAYGRQLGYLLRKRFPDLQANIIFQKIWKNELDYELLDIYKDSRISGKAFNKFFKTLYTYLDNREV